YLKKAQCVKPGLYDIACYRDNIANMVVPDSKETIHIAEESRSKTDKTICCLTAMKKSDLLLSVVYFIFYRFCWGKQLNCLKTCSMNRGEVNLVYTYYIVFATSKEKIQAEVCVEDKANSRYLQLWKNVELLLLLFVLVGYIVHLLLNRNEEVRFVAERGLLHLLQILLGEAVELLEDMQYEPRGS
nr:hypothetical protein [Tanacetum cinerariifolium]